MHATIPGAVTSPAFPGRAFAACGSPPSFRAISFADAQDINQEAMTASAGIAANKEVR